MGKIEKVLTFRASSIGDCLMGKYLLENIRASYPNARHGLVVGSRGAMIRDLLRAYPWIEVHEVNRRNPQSVWNLIRRFWRSDLVCTLYTGGTLNAGTKVVARLLARRGGLIGFTDPSPLNRYLYDTILPHYDKKGVPRLHEVAVLTSREIPLHEERMTFSYIPQPYLLERFGLERGRYIIVGLFSGSEARGLSPRRKQDLIDALVREFPAQTFVFIGTKDERDTLARLTLPARSVVAQTSVQEAAALIDDSLGMVSLGTGTSHIAAHLRVPLVVIVACQGRTWVGKEQFGDAPISVFSVPETCPNGHEYTGYGKCLNAVDMDAVATCARDRFPSETSA